MLAESTYKEGLKLGAIFIFLITAATVMGTLDGFNGLEWIRWFMGGFMIIFGGFKLVGAEVFTRVLPLYDLIGKRFSLYRYIYPLLQVLLGMLFMIGAFSVTREILTIVAALSGLIGMIRVVSHRGAIKLSYFGSIIKLRFSTVIMFENIIMIVLGIIMLIAELAS